MVCNAHSSSHSKRFGLLLLALSGTAAVLTGCAEAPPPTAVTSAASPRTADAEASPRTVEEDPSGCDQLAEFDAAKFSGQLLIDNKYLPFRPGMQNILEGKADGIPHRVTTTVIDLTKKIQQIDAVVIWDVDESEDEVVESELAFFGQDEDGNVWSLGEYPEEFEDGKFIGAPSTWIAGLAGAQEGIHMPGQPRVSEDFHLQGSAPDIEFLDCARVVAEGQTVTVPAGTFRNVLVTEETDPTKPEEGIQTKYHAPGVGIIKVGAAVPGSAPETLELVERKQLSCTELQDARRQALKMDQRGLKTGGVYAKTAAVEPLQCAGLQTGPAQ